MNAKLSAQNPERTLYGSSLGVIPAPAPTVGGAGTRFSRSLKIHRERCLGTLNRRLNLEVSHGVATGRPVEPAIFGSALTETVSPSTFYRMWKDAPFSAFDQSLKRCFWVEHLIWVHRLISSSLADLHGIKLSKGHGSWGQPEEIQPMTIHCWTVRPICSHLYEYLGSCDNRTASSKEALGCLCPPVR